MPVGGEVVDENAGENPGARNTVGAMSMIDGVSDTSRLFEIKTPAVVAKSYPP